MSLLCTSITLRRNILLQRTAQMFLGWLWCMAATFWLRDSTPLAVRQINKILAHPDCKPLFDPKLLDKLYYTDAGHLAPEVGDQRVIYDSSVTPVAVSKLANSQIGSLPHVGFYLTVNEHHGTHHWHLAHGLRHGPHKTLEDLEQEGRKLDSLGPAERAKFKPKADRFSEGQMYHGCSTWLDNQPPEILEEIKQNRYFMHEDCFKHFNSKKSNDMPTLEELINKHPFTYMAFRV